MFTGIVENRGQVVERKARGSQIRFKFKLQTKEKDLKLGESIAVNGVCLTVAKKGANFFEADVVDQTLKATNLGLLKKGSRVNLERSVKYGDRMGGHFVLGHVDGVGKVQKITKKGKNQLWTFKAPKEVMDFVAKKGSLSIDGISLTIQSVQKASFTIALIPHTLQETTLGNKKVGDTVNLEVDMIARYLKVPAHAKKETRAATKKRIQQMELQGF